MQEPGEKQSILYTTNYVNQDYQVQIGNKGHKPRIHGKPVPQDSRKLGRAD
jgi:hypothetical protein